MSSGIMAVHFCSVKFSIHSLSGQCHTCVLHSDPSPGIVQCTHSILSEEPSRDTRGVDASRSSTASLQMKASQNIRYSCWKLPPIAHGIGRRRRRGVGHNESEQRPTAEVKQKRARGVLNVDVRTQEGRGPPAISVDIPHLRLL